MALESFSDSGTNLKQLTLSQPEKERSSIKFDPERELMPEDWEAMLEPLRTFRKLQQWERFAQHAMHLQILSPERSRRYRLDKLAWERLNEELHEYHTEKAVRIAAAIKTLFPDKCTEEHLEEKKIYSPLGPYSQSRWDRADPTGVLHWITLFPHDYEVTDRTEEVFRKMTNRMWHERKEDIEGFAQSAAGIKVIWPERMEEILTDDLWQLLKTRFSELRGRDPFKIRLAEYAMHLKILAAEKVECKDGRWSIQMPKPSLAAPEIKPLPSVRRFYDSL